MATTQVSSGPATEVDLERSLHRRDDFGHPACIGDTDDVSYAVTSVSLDPTDYGFPPGTLAALWPNRRSLSRRGLRTFAAAKACSFWTTARRAISRCERLRACKGYRTISMCRAPGRSACDRLEMRCR